MADVAPLIFHPKKPAFGSACNNCGYCCAVQACGLAVSLLSADASKPCPALLCEDGKSACGLVVAPLDYLLKDVIERFGVDKTTPFAQNLARVFSEDAVSDLGVGMGCDSVDCQHSQAWPWTVMREVVSC